MTQQAEIQHRQRPRDATRTAWTPAAVNLPALRSQASTPADVIPRAVTPPASTRAYHPEAVTPPACHYEGVTRGLSLDGLERCRPRVRSFHGC